MAHSNRKSLRQARGGMTKNQMRKSRNLSKASMSSSDRMQQTVRWMEQNEEKARIKDKEQTSDKQAKKTVYYAKSSGAVRRRKATLKRLENQLVTDGHPLKAYKETNMDSYNSCVTRIKKEIQTLSARI